MLHSVTFSVYCIFFVHIAHFITFFHFNVQNCTKYVKTPIRRSISALQVCFRLQTAAVQNDGNADQRLHPHLGLSDPFPSPPVEFKEGICQMLVNC